MDLHLTSDAPNDAEQSAVDSVLGAPESGLQGAERPVDSVGRVTLAGHAARANRHLLLPVLHAIQERVGWISPGALNYACRRLTVPPTEAYVWLRSTRSSRSSRSPPVVAHICDDIACMTNGAEALCSAMAERYGAAGSTDTIAISLGTAARAWHV